MLRAIANTFANCFKIPELKSRILFTLTLLGICRVMAWITIPGLNGAELMKYFEQHAKDMGGSLLYMYSLFTGGAMLHCAVASLGIMTVTVVSRSGLFAVELIWMFSGPRSGLVMTPSAPIV